MIGEALPHFPCRVYPHEASDGPGNMARDEWMLESVAADPTSAALRVYSWSVPTLSLGYFQSIAEAHADPRWRSAPIVRRATGGGAIWHDFELTYAVVLPATHPKARRAEDLYHAVHEALARLMVNQGLKAGRRAESDSRPTGDRPFLCFLDRDPADVVVGNHKVIGSAQRRRAGALLQHGSILLGKSPETPELPGVRELAGQAGPGLTSWVQEIIHAILHAVSLDRLDASLDASALARIDCLARDVYSNPTWTERR